MEMRCIRFFYVLVLFVLSVACKQDEESAEIAFMSGRFVVNNGNWGDNDADIGIYDLQRKTFFPDMFYTVNSRYLGDLAQDIISVGDDIYIAVSGSQTIFVTDRELRVKKQINAENNGVRLSPRCFATDGVRVYVTYYEGYVGQISPEDYSIRFAQVGPNPDGLDAAGGKLYVADSGGMAYPDYNNTLSVISIDGFERTDIVSVNVNPAKVVASSDGNMVYVFSYGDYAAVPSLVQALDTVSGKLSDLPYESVCSIAGGKNGLLYILCGGYDADWNPLPGTVFIHDMATNTGMGNFVTDGTILPNAYSVSVTSDGYVYVGCSDYLTTGDVFVFTPDGRLYDRFDSQGLNPIKVY